MVENDEIDVVGATARGLDEAERWVDEAMADLGRAHLRHVEAASREIQASAQLKAAEARARQAMEQRARVFGALVDINKLPDGDWSYDRTRAKLVRKG